MIRMPTRTTGAAIVVVFLEFIVVVVACPSVSCYKRDIPVGFLLPTPVIAGQPSGDYSRQDLAPTVHNGFVLSCILQTPRQQQITCPSVTYETANEGCRVLNTADIFKLTVRRAGIS